MILNTTTSTLKILDIIEPYKKRIITNEIETSDYFNLFTHTIIHSVINNDLIGLKQIQSKMSPWLPVLESVFKNTDEQLIAYAEWLLIMELHSASRLYIEGKKDLSDWFKMIHQNNRDYLIYPLPKIRNGVFLINDEIQIITPQSLFKSDQEFINLLLEQKVERYRIYSPAFSNVTSAHQQACLDLYGDHNPAEINKLAFWSLINNDAQKQLISKIIPRYYGGPSGLTPWSINNLYANTQGASKERIKSVQWILNLSESLTDQLKNKNIKFNSIHMDIIDSHISSCEAIAKVGSTHRRTMPLLNELLYYIDEIYNFLERQQIKLSNKAAQTCLLIKKYVANDSLAYV